MLTSMFDSTVVVLKLHGLPACMRNAHIRTGAAWREASCACIVLVYALKSDQLVVVTPIVIFHHTNFCWY